MHFLKIISTLTLLLFLAACSNPTIVDAKLKSVKVEEIQLQKVEVVKTFSTKLNANQLVAIKTEVGGTVENIHFKEGSFVQEGAQLYSIDQTRYQGQHQESVAELQASKARYEQAKKDAQRYKNLWEHNAVEAIELDRVLLQEQTALSDWNVAKAKTNRVSANLKYATIVAPFSGYIGISRVKLGDLVIPNQTILAILAEKNTMAADFFISEKDYFDFVLATQEDEKTMDQKNQDAAFAFELILPNGQKYNQKGKLNFIDNIIDPSTGTLRIQVFFENKDNLLKSGMNAMIEMNLKAESKKLAVVIPQKAIRKILNQNFVYVVNQDHQIEDKKIQMGTSIQDKQIVLFGLEAGELLVVEDIQKISAGQKVDLVK